MLFGKLHDRQPGILQQRHVDQLGLSLDLVNFHRRLQRFHWREFDCRPISLGRGRIAEGFFCHLRDSNNSLAIDTVIIENRIAELHRAQIISGLKISDTGPICLSVCGELVPGVSGWFLFHQPVLRHDAAIARGMGIEQQEAAYEELSMPAGEPE
jgi:hypothetical protein